MMIMISIYIYIYVYIYCGTMLGRSVCGIEWVSVRGSLCLFWRKTYTKCLHARSPTRPEEDEGRQGPRNRRRQSTEQGSWQNRAEQKKAVGSYRVVSRREQSTEVGGSRRSEKSDLQFDIIMITLYATDPWYLSLISCRVIPKTQKMLLDGSLLNTVL